MVIESLQKIMYFGLGAVAISHDKLRQFIEELEARGELSAGEGKKLYEQLSSRLEEEGLLSAQRVTEQFHKLVKGLGLADQENLVALERRVAALEQKIDELMEKVSR